MSSKGDYHMITTEKRFEEDIESFLLSPQGGYTHTTDVYDRRLVCMSAP